MPEILNLSEISQYVKDSAIKCGQTKLIVIDGPAGSGKTTLAKSISILLEKCFVVHMDDIYEGWSSALSPLTTNNLVNWIINPLLQKNPIKFQKYNWIKEKREEELEINPPQFLIIEGVGSSVLEVAKHACLRIWIEVSPEIGMSRVLHRDGSQIQEQMKNWQNQETKFFKQNKSKENSDIWIDGDPVVKIDTSSQFVRTNR